MGAEMAPPWHPPRSGGQTEFRFWTTTSPCPLCQGHGFGGRSGTDVLQCRGGYVPTMPLAAWCSNVPSAAPSPSGKTWRHALRRPLRLKPEPAPQRRSGASWYPRYWPAGVPETWSRIGDWHYQAVHHLDGILWTYSVARFDAPPDERAQLAAEGKRAKEYRPYWLDGRTRPPAPGTPVCWSMPPGQRVPYRLPELLSGVAAGLPVYVVEGEKSADAGAAHTDTAVFTCNPGGSKAWRPEYLFARWFAGAALVRVVVDRDPPGEGWAAAVVADLATLDPAPAITFYRAAVPEPTADLADHLDAGLTLKELEPWTPNPT